MDSAVTLEKLVALGMTEEEARRALEAAGGSGTPKEPEEPGEHGSAEPTGEPEAPGEDEKPGTSGEAKDAQEDEAPEMPEAPEEPGTTGKPETPEKDGGEKAPESGEDIPDKGGLAAENAALRQRLLDIGVRSCALALGVRPERAGAVRRLTDTSAIDPAAENAMDQINEAVRRALEEVPELAGGAGVTAGALGAHPRESQTLDAFARGLGGL